MMPYNNSNYPFYSPGQTSPYYFNLINSPSNNIKNPQNFNTTTHNFAQADQHHQQQQHQEQGKNSLIHKIAFTKSTPQFFQQGFDRLGEKEKINTISKIYNSRNKRTHKKQYPDSLEKRNSPQNHGGVLKEQQQYQLQQNQHQNQEDIVGGGPLPRTSQYQKRGMITVFQDQQQSQQANPQHPNQQQILQQQQHPQQQQRIQNVYRYPQNIQNQSQGLQSQSKASIQKLVPPLKKLPLEEMNQRVQQQNSGNNNTINQLDFQMVPQSSSNSIKILNSRSSQREEARQINSRNQQERVNIINQIYTNNNGQNVGGGGEAEQGIFSMHKKKNSRFGHGSISISSSQQIHQLEIKKKQENNFHKTLNQLNQNNKNNTNLNTINSRGLSSREKIRPLQIESQLELPRSFGMSKTVKNNQQQNENLTNQNQFQRNLQKQNEKINPTQNYQNYPNQNNFQSTKNLKFQQQQIENEKMLFKKNIRNLVNENKKYHNEQAENEKIRIINKKNLLAQENTHPKNKNSIHENSQKPNLQNSKNVNYKTSQKLSNPLKQPSELNYSGEYTNDLEFLDEMQKSLKLDPQTESQMKLQQENSNEDFDDLQQNNQAKHLSNYNEEEDGDDEQQNQEDEDEEEQYKQQNESYLSYEKYEQNFEIYFPDAEPEIQPQNQEMIKQVQEQFSKRPITSEGNRRRRVIQKNEISQNNNLDNQQQNYAPEKQMEEEQANIQIIQDKPLNNRQIDPFADQSNEVKMYKFFGKEKENKFDKVLYDRNSYDVAFQIQNNNQNNEEQSNSYQNRVSLQENKNQEYQIYQNIYSDKQLKDYQIQQMQQKLFHNLSNQNEKPKSRQYKTRGQKEQLQDVCLREDDFQIIQYDQNETRQENSPSPKQKQMINSQSLRDNFFDQTKKPLSRQQHSIIIRHNKSAQKQKKVIKKNNNDAPLNSNLDGAFLDLFA